MLNPTPITLSTQNVGGMRGEFQLKTGPKLAMLRSLITPSTDFLILTETKADHRAIKNTKLRFDLRVSHFSASPHPRGGVVICAKEIHKKLEASERESATPGHIAAAVYEIRKSRTVVIGVYGISDNNDRLSAATIMEISTIADELKLLFNTQHLMIAGDFNAILENEDSSSGMIRKRAANAALHALIDRHNLIDMAIKGNKREHTWFQRGINALSSRLDMILTNIPTSSVTIQNAHTIFDHVHLTCIMSQVKSNKIPPMKDYIIGSDEYLIRAIDDIQTLIEQTSRPAAVLPENEDNNDPPANNGPLDENREFNQVVPGKTHLHVFNQMISRLQNIHNQVAKKQTSKNNSKIREISTNLKSLKRELKQARTPQRKIEINNTIIDIQRTLSTEVEAKDKASQMRIGNFYKTRTGKMTPETFYCIKEKNPGRDILSLEHEGRIVTDPEEIINIMQEWYEETAQRDTPQTTTLQAFLQQHNILLPQISQEHQDMLSEEFSQEEVQEAILEAQAISAPGPTGQSISLYKLLFMLVPDLMVKAINQLVFVPLLGEDTEFSWIKKRRVVYIPKKPQPRCPADYRPLSMLEVLYKIPSRILTNRLSRTLPTIIGPHQHGFMAQKGIQEPSIIATHLIQEAAKHNKPLQLVSFDIEKAFDRVSHISIIQALRAFGVPEIAIMAIQHFALAGYAYVEVNGKKGILIKVKTGSGQGDPISSILFLVATEPLNLALARNFQQIMYTTIGNTTVGPILFADDNLNPLALPNAAAIQPITAIYDQYTTVSGLNINIRKTTALCINTSPEIIQGLQELGINTPTECKHLGIQLGATIEVTMRKTMDSIQPKRIKRRIYATTPPTDLLHRTTLINSALIPMYNHVFMVLALSPNHTEELQKEILKFLWTRQEQGEEKHKRRLVAKDRIAASHHKGGLQVPHPMETAEGLHLNILQKIYRKILAPDRTPQSLLPQILLEVLQEANCTTLREHLEQYGPTQWEKTAQKIKSHNLLFAAMFTAMGKLLRMYERHKKYWHLAAIDGHTLFNTLLPLTRIEANHLRAIGIVTVSQLYETNVNGNLHSFPNIDLQRRLQGEIELQDKLYLLCQALRRLRLPLLDKKHEPQVSGGLLLRGEKNMSQLYRNLARARLDDKIKIAPAYNTRINDNVPYPSPETFNEAYNKIEIKGLPSKTKEVAFQILNRTIWTNNKAFKSNLRDSANCERCDQVETMEHLIYDCEQYSAPLWEEIGAVLTAALKDHADAEIPLIRLSPIEIIYNAHHPSVRIHLRQENLRQTILHLVQELKRDIIYRRMNTPENQRPLNMIRIRAHILSTIRKTISLFQYQGTRNLQNNIILLQRLEQKICERV